MTKQTYRKWTTEETNYLIANYQTLSVKEIGMTLNRSVEAIQFHLKDIQLIIYK